MVGAVQGEPYVQPGASRRALSRKRQLSVGRAVQIAVLVGGPLLLIGALAWPMLFTNGDFNEDWAHHLWFIWNQSFAIGDNHHPSFFLNTWYSVFYPQYAFYGGTLDSLVAALSLALGNAPIEAYVLTYLLGFAASYGGWYWMARMAGLSGWWAQIPGVTFITSSYYLTLIYARGDLPEFMGISVIPLVVASGLSVLRASRLRFWPAFALALGCTVFFGSHNLTIVWGATLMVLLGVAVAVCVPQVRQWLTWGGVMRVASLVIPALLVSAWFLLPATLYESHTQISSAFPLWRLVLDEKMYLVSAQNLFAISRVTAIGGSEFVLSLPTLAMAWSLISIPICWWRRPRGVWVRVLLLCSGLAALVTVVMTHAGLILALPRPYAILQYSYRLESYVMLAVSGAVLAGLVALRNGTDRMRLWTWMLIPILAVAVVGAIQQTDAYPRGGSRQGVLRSRTRSEFTKRILTDYTDAALPHLEDQGEHPAEVVFPAASIHDDRISEVVHLRPGQLVYSNIGGGPELVHVSGAKVVGVDPSYNDVLEIGPSIRGSKSASSRSSRSAGTEVITVSTANGLPVVLGRLLSLFGVFFLLAVFAVLAVRHFASGG